MKRASSSSVKSHPRSKSKPAPKTQTQRVASNPSKSVAAPRKTASPKPTARKRCVSASSTAPKPPRAEAVHTKGTARTPRAVGAASRQSCAPLVLPVESAARAPRAQTKQAQLIEMLGKPSGASMVQMMALTGWQAHAVRGALSGALRKRLGLDVQGQVEEGVRIYRIHRRAGAVEAVRP